ncbi:hypothetical protein AX16_008111 [Volvariella volvacea WC 439]|nr:hypothetical protein AX16_008111 [Volvariella volvacea WC 439]
MLSLLGLKGPLPSILQLLGTITLILCNFSVPFIGAIKIFRVRVNAPNGVHAVDYGLWGYCVPTAQYCTEPHLGFVVDTSVASALSMPGLQDALSSKHTSALIMYPIAVGSTLFTLICTIVLMLSKMGRCTGSWGCFPMTFRYARGLLACYSLSLLTSILALIVEVSIVLKFRDRMNDFRYSNVKLIWGNVTRKIWLTAIAIFANLYCYVLVWWLKKEVQDEIVGRLYPRISKPQAQEPLSPQFSPPPPAPQAPTNLSQVQPYPTYPPQQDAGSYTPPPPQPEFNPYGHQSGYSNYDNMQPIQPVHPPPQRVASYEMPQPQPHTGTSTPPPTSPAFPPQAGGSTYPQPGYPAYPPHAQGGYSPYPGNQ